MKAILILILVFCSNFSQAQNTSTHNSFINSSVGVAFPIGEFGSVDWYNNQSVGLACSGITSDLITYGKFFKKNTGIGAKLNATINSMYNNRSVDKKPYWTSIGVGVGGLFRHVNSNWDYGAELWFSYMWLSGTSIFINGHQLVNSPFFGAVVDFAPNISYHITDKNSLVLKSGIVTNIGEIKHKRANDIPKKQYRMLKFQVGLIHWIE